MADNVLESFLVSVGIKIDGDGAKKVEAVLDGLARGATTLATALGAAAVAATAAVAKIASSFDQIYFISQRTGASATNIKGLAYAFEQVGSSGDTAVSSIESFARAMRTNPGVQSFVRSLGVATTASGKARDNMDILSDAIEAIQKKNPYFVGAQYAELLGIDEATFETLTRYSKEIKEFRAEYDRTARVIGLNNEAATVASNKFWTALRSLQATIAAVAQKLAIELLPHLTAFVEKIREWIAANPEAIKDGILAISAAVAALATAFMDVVAALKPVAVGFQALAESLTGKEGLQASFELLAVFIAGSWLSRILGAFSKVRLGWLALAAVIGLDIAKNATPEGRANTIREGEDAINREQGGESPYQKGILRRGYERLKGALGIGGAEASEAGPSKPLGKIGQNANAQAIIKTLREAGYNNNAIAAIVGSMQTESSFNPRISNNIKGGHTGLWQWDRNRWPKIANWIKQQGGDPYDAAWQTKAWIAEHNAKPGDAMYDHHRTERGGKILKNNPSLPEAIHGVRESERFGAGEEGGRANHARRWLPVVEQSNSGLRQSSSEPTPPTPPLNFPKMNATPGGFDINGALRTAPAGAASLFNTSDNSRKLTNSPTYNVTVTTTGNGAATAEAFGRTARDLNGSSLRDMRDVMR